MTTPDRDLVMARDCYDDCIAALDAQLGRLLESLQSQGLLENTEVIITSDHGEAFGFMAAWATRSPSSSKRPLFRS